ncbi:glycogen debranching protein GlgX [Microterricola pindariensis]|uniref:Glycogen debranching enzyme GlgX n=1 Tax=Microterricola pindariensis TaxID=478010 RepID=A0ABX5AUU8_9MICO|nr:glycogen debranching protein GlgX [Microterricola pindariensis]PPL16198.1 glycogen debranching enzyme GlgX [Microterricola pindariensis]
MSPGRIAAGPGFRATSGGGELRVWSASATAMEIVVFDEADPGRVLKSIPMVRGGHDIWHGRSRSLVPGRRYALRADGPGAAPHAFDRDRLLVDPYARGLSRTDGLWQSVIVDDGFDWNGALKPATPLDESVIYEMHVRGFSKLNPAVPAELRGSYAGLAHEASIAALRELGVTAVELLPVHALLSEQRLLEQGLRNYWGYNTLNFFSPHAGYATAAAQAAGPDAVLREFKGMVKLLHEAGIEVILDVVYNHTAEEGPHGPTTSFRGLDNANYYRVDAHGAYIDTTGCGNTVNFGNTAPSDAGGPARLVLDSLRYWANEVQIDGFRFDLAATLGRDANVAYDRQHPLPEAILDDPALQGVKMIAEPWDVGINGWQTGNFADGWTEWNDRYRDRMRDFWLTDIARERGSGSAGSGIGRFATRLAGSSNTFSGERGPLASLNFVTAHDGFTLADLTAYNQKHNLGNGEGNRDGSDNNNSFNHGQEGPSDDPAVLADRRKAMRNLLGTLLFSAGVPMLTAGDEFGRSQHGNNNAYCHDTELGWLGWVREPWQEQLHSVTARLIALRRANPALRPQRYARLGEHVPGASQMDWFDADGLPMSEEDWNAPEQRTLQYLAASTPVEEEFNRILLVVHATESERDVALPSHEGVDWYETLWDSADDCLGATRLENHAPGAVLRMAGTSMRLLRAH